MRLPWNEQEMVHGGSRKLPSGQLDQGFEIMVLLSDQFKGILWS